MPSNPQSNLALVPVHRRSTPELSLVPRQNNLQVTQASSGPGLFFHANVSNAGLHIERAASVVAHKLGWGPCAATERIVEIFGDGIQRQSKLDELYDSNKDKNQSENMVDLGKLRKDCKALAKYARDPKETEDTQIQAFKCIIMVITRYVGLRHSFPSLDAVPMPNEEDTGLNADGRHLSDFAMFCMSKGDVFLNTVEKRRPSDLAVLAEQDRTVIETLQSTAIADSEGLEKLVAIRYLAGILELPSFWNNPVNERLLQLVGKLCETAVTLIDNIRIESDDILAREVVCDFDGIDLLCRAILAGLQDSSEILDAIKSCPDSVPLAHLVKLVSQLNSKNASILFQEAYPLAQAMTDMIDGRNNDTTNDQERSRTELDTKMRPDPAQATMSLSFQLKISLWSPPKLSLWSPPKISFSNRRGMGGGGESWKTKVVKPGDSLLADSREGDIIIPVMGPSGAGKSTFINAYLGRNMAEVGHSLMSFTTAVKPFFVPLPQLEGRERRLVLVDTPGFDDTNESDVEILRRIAVWLASSYGPGKTCGGIIYLHDISDARMRGTTLQNLKVFQRLCGKKNLGSVVFGTTKSGQLTAQAFVRRESHLREVYWKEFMKQGARAFKLHPSHASAEELVKMVLDREEQHVLLIQRELVDFRKTIPETEAGQALKYSLEEIMAHQKSVMAGGHLSGAEAAAVQAKVAAVGEQLKSLEIPLTARTLMFFGLG